MLRGSLLKLSVEISDKFFNVDKSSTKVQRPGVVDSARDDSLQKRSDVETILMSNMTKGGNAKVQTVHTHAQLTDNREKYSFLCKRWST